MSFFDKHVFICCNQRSGTERCCNNHGATQLLDYMRNEVKALGLTVEGKIRINKAGCLGRCEDGPVMVVYPEQRWYTFIDTEDIDNIVAEHLLGEQVVERLKI